MCGIARRTPDKRSSKFPARGRGPGRREGNPALTNPNPALTNPALTATAADLGKQFKADVQKLREKFGGKWLYVEGEVVSTGKSSVDGPQFTLKGDGGMNVVCSVPADNKAKVEALKPGQKVKALGEFSSPFPNDKELSLNMVLFKGL